MAKTNKSASELLKSYKTQLNDRLVVALEAKIQNIDNEVESMLNKCRDEVLLKFLGFNNKWAFNKWEVDSCNGRAGNSFVGAILVKKVQAAAETWLEKALGDLPPPPKDVIKSAYSEYRQMLRYRLEEMVHHRASELVDTQVDDILAGVIKDDEPG